MCQQPIHKALATYIWVATHALRNAGLALRFVFFRFRNNVVDIF